MKVKFAWVDMWKEGNLNPTCGFDDVPIGFEGCIGALLMDDGGCGYLRGMEFFKEARVGRTRLQSAAWKPHNYIRRTASGYALLAGVQWKYC